MATNIAENRQKASDFAQKRLSEVGVTLDNNKIILKHPDADFPKVQEIETEIFTEDSEGNIKILYSTIDRDAIVFEKKGSGKMSAVNAKEQLYYQIRLHKPSGDNKYSLPKGQPTYPFFPPMIQDKFERGEVIETLILTEGAFKAFKGATCGLDVVGLPSITCYKDHETKRLYRDIERLMGKCQVKNLVILWDGDCRNISETDLGFGNDLINRPIQFQNSAKAIFELAQKIELQIPLSIRFACVNSANLEHQPKGLDDLLNAFSSETESICNKLNTENTPPQYFLSVPMLKGLKSFYAFFAMHDERAFYDLHSEKIGDAVFNFRGNRYQYDFENAALSLVSSAWSKNILWIGDEYFELINAVVSDGSTEKHLIKREISTLKRRFGKDFSDYVHYYDGFCNVPSHFDYQPVIGNHYNRYAPFKHTAFEGDCPKTFDFIKHIFGQQLVEHNGQQTPQYELGLDYLQLLIMQPTQKLPIVVLFSKENNTGKSLFGKWLQFLFGQNAVTVGNQTFESEFNEFWADKLLIICEETLLEKKAASEKIKAYSTANDIPVNPKGQKQFTIDFFGKFQFYSNNEKMLYMTKYDQRFWILEIPVPPTDDPDLLERLKEETPAFLQFIKHRKMATKRESRMYFHTNWLKTPSFFRTVRLNEPSHAQELRERLKESFLDFGQSEIRMAIQDIIQEFFNGKGKMERTYLQRLLKDHLNVGLAMNSDGKFGTMRYSYFVHTLVLDNDEDVPRREEKRIGRPYLFKRSDFVTKEEEGLNGEG